MQTNSLEKVKINGKMRYLRDIMRDRRETLENASIAVINRYKDSDNTTRSLTDLPDMLPWEDQEKIKEWTTEGACCPYDPDNDLPF